MGIPARKPSSRSKHTGPAVAAADPLRLAEACALIRGTRFAEAAAVLERTLAARPDAAEAWALLGGVLSLSGHSDQGLSALSQAIHLKPAHAGFHYDLGVVLGGMGESRAAEAAYREALELRAHFPEALNNLGNLLRLRHAAEDAIPCYRRALDCRPGYTDANYNLGLALQDLDLLDEAETCYETVLNAAPEHHAALNNLANVRLGLGKVDAALIGYEAAVRLVPASRDYRVNLGIAQLLRGDFAEGWRNYAFRPAPGRPGLPLWTGEPIRGRRILLLSEQGLGDTLQFIRYARHLRYAGGRVSALCPEPLTELLRTAPGVETVTTAGEEPPACDWYAPLLHLPNVLRTRAETVPAEMPYLSANPERIREWAVSLNIPASHLKVGIAWRGGVQHWNDRNRSLLPSDLAVLDGLPETAWISLQKGFRRGCESLPFTPLHRELGDLADTAALVAQLDLVISVDTSVAHLAGALASPVWTLLPFAPDWRWMRERTDSPWYPSMTLFRQERRGEWRGVMERVREDLMKMRKR